MLQRSLRNGRLAHALLLAGPQGVGKELAAGALAARLLCHDPPADEVEPCGACESCRLLASGNHPDFHLIHRGLHRQHPDRTIRESKGLSLVVDVVRHFLIEPAYTSPSLGRRRVFVVRDAERMNEAAQNAFLKTLEEPGADVVILLESSRPAALLPTIRSRVVPIAFGRLEEQDAAAALVAAGLGAEEAAALARWSGGAPGQALALAARGAPEMRELILGVALGELLPAEAGARIWELEGEFPGKTPAAQRRARAGTLLDVGLELWLDVERGAAGVPPAELAHGDRIGVLPPLPQVVRDRRMESWLLARQDVALNLSPEALVDRALAAAAPPAPGG